MNLNPHPMQTFHDYTTSVRQAGYCIEILAHEGGLYSRCRYGWVMPQNFVKIPPQFAETSWQAVLTKFEHPYFHKPLTIKDGKPRYV